jgi:DNA-binding NarL/FixJ family response regulator
MSDRKIVIANRFELGRAIGGGGAGLVSLGIDTQTGQQVAIKALRKELVAGLPELVERFRREGEALRALNHPNIVKVLATIEEDGQHYLVMEYVGGGSLADLIRREGQLAVERAVSISLELSDALSRAHHLNILHRDLKPGNILLAEDGTPRLTDFGLARVGHFPPVTLAGSVLGTFHYLSPEACELQPLDERSDLWSFGIILYQMLTGRLPFEGDSPLEIISAIKNQPTPDVTWHRSDLPPALVRLVRRMLMKDRAARIDSARLVGAELEAIQREIRLTAAPARAPSPAASATAAPAPRIRVMIVDDHAVVRQGLRTFLELNEDITVVGEAADGAQAVETAGRNRPDVVLLDVVMPVMDGVTAAGKILACSPNSKILILTSFSEEEKIFPAIRAGALGYLLKDIPPNELAQAVREAHAGRVQLHPDIARKLMTAVAAQPAPGASPPPAQPASLGAEEMLTERELEVLGLIAQGLNNREIAERMIISEKTVKTHVSNLLGKLQLEDRTQAAIYALKHGLAGQE